MMTHEQILQKIRREERLAKEGRLFFILCSAMFFFSCVMIFLGKLPKVFGTIAVWEIVWMGITAFLSHRCSKRADLWQYYLIHRTHFDHGVGDPHFQLDQCHAALNELIKLG